MGVRGPKSKSKNNVLYSGKWRNDGQKWLDSVEKRKRRSNLKERDRQTDRHPDRQTESTADNNDSKLGTEINK